METPLWDKGSGEINENTRNNSNKLKVIIESLKSLTNPQKINELAEKLNEKGILTDKDMEKLIADGIIKEQFPNLEIQHDKEKASNSNSNPMIEENDDMEMDL